MKKIFFYILLVLLIFNFEAYSKENFFNEAKNLFDKEKYDESKFLFQRNIVFNPKDSESYLYLAKIFNNEDNEREEEKNLNTALLLDPKNESAMFMLIEIQLKKSNFSKVKELTESFESICNLLCENITFINNKLKNLEAIE